jgi:1-acyl-sn-glycerol-3-phosphate acyltransferase
MDILAARMSEDSPTLAPDRRQLVDGLLALVGQSESPDARRLRSALVALVESVSDAALADFAERLRTTGGDWGYHAPDPTARELSHVVLGQLIEAGSQLEGAEHLAELGGRPAILLANHLAFVDANALEALLWRAGLRELCMRLCVVVGPKVFSLPLRRVASLCFGSLKIPQSQSRASDEALMSPREAARIAAEVVGVAAKRMDAGDALLIFVEGTRSRDGAMQRALPGVARYLEYPDALLVPIGLTGTEKLVRIGDERLHSARIGARVGAPLDGRLLLERCRNRRAMIMDAVGLAIAGQLPAEYRGAYASVDPALEPARQILTSLCAPGR